MTDHYAFRHIVDYYAYQLNSADARDYPHLRLRSFFNWYMNRI